MILSCPVDSFAAGWSPENRRTWETKWRNVWAVWIGQMPCLHLPNVTRRSGANAFEVELARLELLRRAALDA